MIFRYSMQKKFALLTAQMKSEKRFSRRMEYRRSITVAAAATQHLHHNPNGASPSSNAQDPLHNVVSTTASFPAPHHHRHQGYHGGRHGLPVGYRRSFGHHHPSTGLVVDGGVLRGGQVSSSGTRVPVVVQRHSASCRYRDRSRGQSGDEIAPLQSNPQAKSLSVIDSQSQAQLSGTIGSDATDIGESSNPVNIHLSTTSGPSLQSFPLDETCIYNNQQLLSTGNINKLQPSSNHGTHTTSILQTGSSSTSSTVSSSPRCVGQQPNRDVSPHTIQHQRQRRAQGVAPPNVPRRTVSRLTSAEAITASAATISLPTTSPESSSTIIAVTSASKQPQPKQSPSASIASNTSVNSMQSASSSHQSSPQMSSKGPVSNTPYLRGKQQQQHELSIPIHQ